MVSKRGGWGERGGLCGRDGEGKRGGSLNDGVDGGEW
jgi:hypothetical protein